MQVVKYMFQPHGDDRGQLIALEEFNDIPFRIKNPDSEHIIILYDRRGRLTREKGIFLPERAIDTQSGALYNLRRNRRGTYEIRKEKPETAF